MKCIGCGIKIPDMPEDASLDELLCDFCYARFMRHIEKEGVDICSKCEEIFPYGSLEAVSEDSFELLCERCKK